MLGLDARAVIQQVLSRLDGHDHFLQGRVSGPFADAVDRAFDLPDAMLQDGQRIGYGDPEVIVTVNGNDDIPEAFYLVEQIGDQRTELIGQRIPHGVRNVDRRGSCGDDRFNDFTEVIPVRPRGIHGREFDVGRVAPGMGYGGPGLFQNLGPRLFQLILQVNVRRGQEGMNARVGRLLDGLPGPVNIFRICPGKTCNLATPDFPGDLLDGEEIPLGSHGKPGFDDIHTQFFQLPCNAEFLLRVHAASRRLLAVSQRRVEDQDSFALRFFHGFPLLKNKKRPWGFAHGLQVTPCDCSVTDSLTPTGNRYGWKGPVG